MPRSQQGKQMLKCQFQPNEMSSRPRRSEAYVFIVGSDYKSQTKLQKMLDARSNFHTLALFLLLGCIEKIFSIPERRKNINKVLEIMDICNF
jgi:hypothetical protein